MQNFREASREIAYKSNYSTLGSQKDVAFKSRRINDETPADANQQLLQDCMALEKDNMKLSDHVRILLDNQEKYQSQILKLKN